MKYWELIADALRASGLSWGCSSQIAVTGRLLPHTTDAYCNDGKRFTVIAEDKLIASLEPEKITRKSLRF
jgi:hypothetical protein